MISVELTPSFPVYSLDTDLVKNAFSNMGPAIDDKKYERAVELASIALDKIQEFLLTTLDHRSYALGMSARFEEAVRDAQDMITYQPTLAKGYLRLGNIYRMQGKQRSAIDVYNQGLQNVSMDHPDYPEIVNDKDSATKQAKERIDFVTKLPIELVDEILTLLPDDSKLALWSVSSKWRIKISECSVVWEALTSGDGTKTDWTTDVMPYIATHVKDLTITTGNCGVLSQYLRTIKNGKFKKLKSLTIDANATKHIIDSIVTKVFSNALWSIHNTLTSLVINLHPSSTVVPLTAILSVCSNLKYLEYSTPTYLSQAIGEFAPPNFESSLVDMQLEAKSITGRDLQKLFPLCQQVRRLLLYGCYTSVLGVIDTICPSLETFGYNPLGVTIPRIESTNVRNSVPGLCRLYTKNGGQPEPASAFLPLIRRIMFTLKELHINISAKYTYPFYPSITAYEYVQPAMYEDLELTNLESLTLSGQDEVMIPVIARSISGCTALAHVELITPRNISALVDRLIALPQLETFGISHDLWFSSGEEDLVRLFDMYATDFRSERRLRRCWLRHISNIVTKEVISSLAGVQTLEDITFEYLPKLSATDLNDFFEMRGNSLSYVKLSNLDNVLNDTLAAIGSHSNNLKSIHLEKLKKVKDQGIVELVDQAPKLQSLTLVDCKSITAKAIARAKNKIKSVVVIST